MPRRAPLDPERRDLGDEHLLEGQQHGLVVLADEEGVRDAAVRGDAVHGQLVGRLRLLLEQLEVPVRVLLGHVAVEGVVRRRVHEGGGAALFGGFFYVS